MKNLGVVITDGVGYRNFILSDFIEEAKDKYDKVILFSCLPKEVYNSLDLDCEIIELAVYEENFLGWFFKKAKEVTHLQLHAKGNFGIADNLNIARPSKRTPRSFATRLIYLFSSKIHSEKWILRYNRWQQKTFRSNPITKQYIQLLKDNSISMLVFTHQRPPFIAPLIFAAEKLKINTSVFIFSWDNLASKGRMAGNFDYFLVWSDLMKQELLYFYQSIKESQISIVGTPQFEPYILKRYGYDITTFQNKFKLDKSKKTILFTCNDSSSKNDPIYLEILAKFISDKKLASDVNLIVRTSPAEEPMRFKTIVDTYPFIIWNYPDWKVKREGHQEPWTQRVPSIEDLNDLKSLLCYCDLIINVLSTITLDSFIFDKPVINPVFGNEQNGMYDDQRFLNYKHLSNLVASESSHIVKNEAAFLDAINIVLTSVDTKGDARKEFLKLQIGKPLEGTSKRIAEVLFKNTVSSDNVIK